MEEVRTLELKAEEGMEPTNRELSAEIAEVKTSILHLGQPVEEAACETAIQKVFREAEEGRSPELLRQAEEWVIRQMGGRLKVQKGPARGPGAERVREIVFHEYTVTQDLKDAGKTTLPIGFKVSHNMPVPAIARYYIDIILDEESYGSDAEKLFAIIANSQERNTHPAEFKHLFDEGGQLKPLMRGRKRKRT